MTAPELIYDIAAELKDPLLLIIGGLIGFTSSLAMWRKQSKKQDRDKKADYILRGITLAMATGTFTRSLLYSKLEGVGGTLKLPENPVDELMALGAIHLDKALPVIQKLHISQNAIFKHSDISAEAVLTYLAETENDVNALIQVLGKMSDNNK